MNLRVSRAFKSRLDLAVQMRPGLTLSEVFRMACRRGNRSGWGGVGVSENLKCPTHDAGGREGQVLTVLVPEHELAGRTPEQLRRTVERYLAEYDLTPPDRFETDLVEGTHYFIQEAT
jgi:hypothetical protein